MIKMMPILHQQAYVMARNFYNVWWSTQRNPWDRLPPFSFDGVIPASYTVSDFEVRPYTYKGAYKTIGTSEVLTSSLVKWKRGDNSDTFYYLALAILSLSITTGLHEMYVKLSNGAEYISEPFYYITACGTTGTTGDYAKASPNDDYSNDYYK